MDLSDGDITLLGVIRKRYRTAKYVIVLFAIKGLLLTGVAVWFSIGACHPSQVSAENPQWLLDLLVQQGKVFATGFYGLIALLNGMLSYFTWIQNKSDALILKLVDRASGYPTPR